MDGKQLKNSILQWAIQGKLVPQNPKDEPAQKLLEKIALSRHSERSEESSKRSKKASTSLRGAKATKQSKNPPFRIYRENDVWYEQVGTAAPKDISDEIPFEIPENWAWCRIGDIFYHTSGKQQSSSNKKGSPQKFITTSNLYWGRFVLDNVKVMNFTDEEIKSCSATKGDLLVCEGGAGYGRSAIWNEDYDICLQNHIHRLRPCVNGICEYVYYFIYLLKETNRLVSVGTAMPGLSANRLKGLILPLPPLAEQKRIVAKLEQVLPLAEEYGAAQEQLDKLNKELPEALKKSILQEAIQGKLVPQNPKDEPAQKLLEKIALSRHSERSEESSKRSKKASKDQSSRIYRENGVWYEQVGSATPKDISDEIPFEIPETWAWCRIQNISQSYIGLTYKPDEVANEGTVVLRSSNIKNGKIVLDDIVRVKTSVAEKLFVEENDILICARNGSKKLVGKAALIPHMEEKMTFGAFMAICKTPFYAYTYFYLLSDLFYQQLWHVSGTTTINQLTQNNFNHFLIPLPPLAEQKRIVAKLEQLFKVL